MFHRRRHPGRWTLTGEEDEDCGRRDVAGRATPAAGHARPEGHEHHQEGHDEQGDHGAAHVCEQRQSLVDSARSEKAKATRL